MSKIDTFLNLDQSLKLRGLSKLSEAQLKVSLANNSELRELRAQISHDNRLIKDQFEYLNESQEQSLVLQNKILENQITEIEIREIQKFHKQRLFQCKEYLNDYYKLSDMFAKTYLATCFLPLIQSLILESKNKLEEINDKEFALKLQEDVMLVIKENEKSNNHSLAMKINDLDKNILSEKYIQSNYSKDIESLIIQKENKKIQNTVNEEIHKNKIDKKEKTYRTRRLFAIIFGTFTIIRILSEVSDSNFHIESYILLVPLTTLFIFLTVKAKNEIKSLKSEIDPVQNRIYDGLGRQLDSCKKKMIDSSNKIEKLESDYDILVRQLVKIHPDFKIIEYTFV